MQKQNQHRVSQVYLKEFGYQTEGGPWKISALETDKFKLMLDLDKLFFTQQNIKSTTAEYNIFDLVDGNPDNVTLLEDLNGKIETWYPTIIKDIKKNSELSEASEDILIQFISNLLCRVEPFRQLIFSHINSNNRLHFLRAMCVFQEDKGRGFVKILDELSIEAQLNPVCFVVMEHIMNKLSCFDYVILNEYQNRGWITSDNPVILDNNISSNSIFSIDTEVYFPLSKDFCIFFSHPNAKVKNNILRTYRNKSFINATKEIQEMIYEKVRINADKLIFFPLEINKYSSLNIINE